MACFDESSLSRPGFGHGLKQKGWLDKGIWRVLTKASLHGLATRTNKAKWPGLTKAHVASPRSQGLA